jgi:hypothetical protein
LSETREPEGRTPVYSLATLLGVVSRESPPDIALTGIRPGREGEPSKLAFDWVLRTHRLKPHDDDFVPIP